MIEFLIAHAVVWPVLVPIGAVGVTACLWNHRAAQRTVSLVAAVVMLASSVLLLSVVLDRGSVLFR